MVEKKQQLKFKHMKALLEKLGLDVKEAGTGTLYVNYNGKLVRVADHEPNFSMTGKFREAADLEIYTKDACNNIISDKYDIVEKVAKFLNIEIKGSLKSILTKNNNKKEVLLNSFKEIKKEQDLFLENLNSIKEDNKLKISEIIKGKEEIVKNIISESEAYGSLGANGDKRRKRTKSYFRTEFVKTFGLDADLSEVRDLVK